MTKKARTSFVEKGLVSFQKNNRVTSKGSLATVLFITRRAMKVGLPFPLEKIRTKNVGQVAGLGRDPVQKILADHRIRRVLAEEGGRTSRGSLGLAERYVTLLNFLHHAGHIRKADLKTVEAWWIEKIKEYFNRQCFKLDIDPRFSISKTVTLILKEAKKRQDDMPGMAVEGAVLQHLVGAKLSLALGKDSVRHHGASVADAADDREGDFQMGDAAIHVTTSPSERLMQKCGRNLSKALRPIIVCPKDKVEAASQMAESVGIKDRIEIYGAEAFISMNVNELAGFHGAKIRATTRDLFERYNEIASEVENDPSLLIEEK